MNETIQLKVLDEYNAAESPTQNVGIYFPFQYQKSLFNRYRAQLFYAPSSNLSNISIGIARGSRSVSGAISIKIQAFNAVDTTNYGLNTTDTSDDLATASITVDNKLPLYEIYNETIYLTEQAQPVVVNITDPTTPTNPLTVTAGNFYWILIDCGRVYNSTIQGYTIPDIYFLMTKSGFSAIGNSTTGSSYYTLDASVPINPGVSKTETGSWNFTDTIQDHIILVNGNSLIKFGYSLDNITYSGSAWSDGHDLYKSSGWQLKGVKDFSITDTTIGGVYNSGVKTLYTRFYRMLGTQEQTSEVISSTINYLPRIPIVTEVLVQYIRKY